jgi:hypothetical protein
LSRHRRQLNRRHQQAREREAWALEMLTNMERLCDSLDDLRLSLRRLKAEAAYREAMRDG